MDTYDIYVNCKGKFTVKKNNTFPNSFGWLNQVIVTDASKGVDVIHCDEKHIEDGKKRLLKHLIRQQEYNVKVANRELDKLKKLEAELK